MKPKFPKFTDGKTVWPEGTTLNQILAEIRRCMAQAGNGLMERPAGENGTFFDIDPAYVAPAVGRALCGPTYNPEAALPQLPSGLSGILYLPAGASWFPATSSTTMYAISSATFDKGVLTAITP